jgi:hypothetical protein
MNKISILILIVLTTFSVIGVGDLIIELQEPVLLPRNGFSEDVFLPFKIVNIGDEAITSRYPVKMINPNSRSGTGYPLYLYSGDLGTVGVEPLLKAPVQKADGNIEWREIISTQIKLDQGIIPNAPTITLQANESLLFTDYDLIGSLTTFSFSESGTYTLGYEVDEIHETNEVEESNDINNKQTISMDIEVQTYVKGPNNDIGIESNEYWFYFKNLNDCVTLDLPASTKICLLGGNAFSTTLSVGNDQIKLYHFFELFGFSKSLGNLDFVAGDGYIVTVN